MLETEKPITELLRRYNGGDQAVWQELVPYVYEDELYGRVGMNMPSLTLGVVLLRLHRLRARANLSPSASVSKPCKPSIGWPASRRSKVS